MASAHCTFEASRPLQCLVPHNMQAVSAVGAGRRPRRRGFRFSAEHPPDAVLLQSNRPASEGGWSKASQVEPAETALGPSTNKKSSRHRTAPFPERRRRSHVRNTTVARRRRRLRPADLRLRAHAWTEGDWATTDPDAGLPRRPKLPLARTFKFFRAEVHRQRRLLP